MMSQPFHVRGWPKLKMAFDSGEDINFTSGSTMGEFTDDIKKKRLAENLSTNPHYKSFRLNRAIID